MRQFLLATKCIAILAGVGSLTSAQSAPSGGQPGLGNASLPGLGPALTPRVTQDDITNGSMTLDDIRAAGLRIFATPFNKFDGMGDGPIDPNDPTKIGGRPTIGGNGTWLRVNGLDSQTCTECHFMRSVRDIPMDFAIGGVGGINASAFPGIINFDLGDADANGIADVDGRKINPPFLFGAGGVEMIAKEMTLDLQGILADAQADPGTSYSLDTHGVNFGSITVDGSTGVLDTSAIQGVDDDLVVRPFGRKGDNATVRKFDTGALQFHQGMQPEEIFGSGVDADGDGIADEILIGELSALHVFTVSTPHPDSIQSDSQKAAGEALFTSLGCANCHVPSIDTYSTMLPVAYPEVETDPNANVFLEIDLKEGSAEFESSEVTNGVTVPLFSDLKRHDIGTIETTGSSLDNVFVTPRLWGVADTAPYLHDGRALTLTDAILTHANEAQTARDNFANLDSTSQLTLLAFLDGLRTPKDPNKDLIDD